MAAKDNCRAEQGDETSLRAVRVTGMRSIEFPDGGDAVWFVSDGEYRRVMRARGFSPKRGFSEFMDAEDFTSAIRVKVDGVCGMLCTT